jgi:hypothetical protein
VTEIKEERESIVSEKEKREHRGRERGSVEVINERERVGE